MPHADQISDTSPEAAAAHDAAVRRLGTAGRLRAVVRFSAAMISRSRAALRSRHPDSDERELLLLWIRQTYGTELARAVEDAWEEATSYGTMTEGPRLDRNELFEDVYKDMPAHLIKQRDQLRELES